MRRFVVLGPFPGLAYVLPQIGLYWPVVDAIEKAGGPSLIDSFAPASWLIARAVKARWPHCIETARPYLAEARN
jgi:hypothetical protein